MLKSFPCAVKSGTFAVGEMRRYAYIGEVRVIVLPEGLTADNADIPPHQLRPMVDVAL